MPPPVDSPILLSICIPTFQRARYLTVALESIARQAVPGVEVVISDNASDDDTREVVRSFQQRWPCCTYHRWDRNQGPDLNWYKVIELARGRYCWLFGDDDAFTPGALEQMLLQIRDGQDIYLCNSILCRNGLEPVRPTARFRGVRTDHVFSLYSPREIDAYLRKARNLDGGFSYLSSLVFRRDRWMAVSVPPAIYKTCYLHVFMMLSIVRAGATVKYVHAPLLYTHGLNLAGNPHPTATQTLVQVALDFDSLGLIAHQVFGDSPELYRIYDSYLRRCFRFRVIEWRACFNRKDWREIETRLHRFGFSRARILRDSALSYCLSWALRARARLWRLLGRSV